AAAFAATDEFDREGSYSPIHWIRTNCHMTGGAAADRVAVGEQVERVPQTVEAMAGGQIGFPHLDRKSTRLNSSHVSISYAVFCSGAHRHPHSFPTRRSSDLAAAFAATDEFDREGSYSPIHWIRTNCHMTGGAAADRVAVGEQVERVPQTVEAMAGGQIGFPH